jgi:ferritin-like metal-binding protein YciE
MVKSSPIEALFIRTIRSAYSAETQFRRVLPKITQHSTSEGLRATFENLEEATGRNLARLDLISRRHDLPLTEKGAAGMTGIVEEMQEILMSDEDSLFTDLSLVTLIGKAIHCRLATYGSALAQARALEWSHAVASMESILEDEEESAATLVEWMVALCSEAGAIRKEKPRFPLNAVSRGRALASSRKR